MIRIVLADDHAIVREGLVAMIDRQPDMSVVGAAANGRDAVDLWALHRPDVTLLDLRMPLLDGVAAIQHIRRLDHGARIILLTTFDTDHDIARAIKAGARAYLLKDALRDEIFDCIRQVHGGATCIAPGLIAKLAVGMSAEDLTERELEVLTLVAAGRSNRDIGELLFVGETTVKSHLRSIFVKLNVASRTEAVSLANRRGLVHL
ncbi:response regulator transcription factor [Rugamonas sp.]|uniref:response regulator transcription factor n=1 Tax=Rugamonas sp. TaxID=1926287 RepID=UPI0025E0B269|nr:response regulator transcription factor [Rugamonas sp.]